MEKKERPIGVFDSGLGGISVLRELAALMPHENYIFYGDSKHAPYGTKTLAQVRELACEDAAHLAAQGVKALVVACNTATSAAIPILRETYTQMPVIGIEPALKPAVFVKAYPRVLVMATPMTLREQKFRRLMERFRERARIIPLPCPGLVEFVERGELHGERLKAFLRELFEEYQTETIDCVVLGCTHYPFVKQTIQKVLGAQTLIFDGGAGTARETQRRLKECGLLNPSQERGEILLQNSLNTREMEERGRLLLTIDQDLTATK